MICPYCNLSNENWSEQVDMGFVCVCEHPANDGDQGYVRCRFLTGTALAEQWRREREAVDGGCCG